MTRPILVGVEHEYQLDPLRGPLDFRQMIHALGIDGARLDPGDVYAYRLRSGAVLTADGITAEVATPPVPFAADCADTLSDLQRSGLGELTRVLPEDTPIFGYSTHISVSVPDHLNDELSALYARTFGPALMFQMNSITTEGIFIRPRPRRIEFCGNYLADDRLRGAATFAAASVQACLSYLEGDTSALDGLPADLEVTISADPIRYGLHLSADSFSLGVSEREQDLLLRSGSGAVTLGELLRASWEAVQPFLQDTPPAEDSPADSGSRPIRDRGASPSAGGATVAARPATAYLDRHELAAYGAILDPVVRPRFTVSAAVAVWDFTIFEVADDRRAAYVTVPRALLPAFWAELTAGARDAQIEGFLTTEARGRVLETNEQTQELGLWDDLVISQRLLSPERLPSAAAIRATSEGGGTSERGPGASGSGTAPGPASISTVATTAGAPRPGKRPRSLIPGHGGAPIDDTPTGGDEVPGRPGKQPAEMDPGRLGKIPLESPPLISIPSPFGRPIWLGLLIALLVLVIVIVVIALGGGSDTEGPLVGATGSSTAAATETQTSGVSAAPPVVGPITALLQPPITTYSIEATSPDGLTLTYRWTLVADAGQDCGTTTPSDAATATAGRSFVQWSHANEAPDDCDHTAADHPFNIEVEVSDGVNPAVTRSYRGSESGSGTTTAD